MGAPEYRNHLHPEEFALHDDAVEAAECVKAFKPKIIYPYHNQIQNPEEFKAALANEPVEVRLLNW